MTSNGGDSMTATAKSGSFVPTAHDLLLQQLTGAHLQLRQQENLTNQALSEKRILQEKVNLLKLELEIRDRDLAASRENLDESRKTVFEAPHESGDRSKHHERRFLQDKSESEGPARLTSCRPYVCLLIDGDANHFLPELMRAGGRGGEVAAERLRQEVSKFIAERRYIPRSCLLKLQVFMNRTGYLNTVNQCDKIPKDVIDSCLDRFFQSQPLWDLVDTGGLKESADTKIKANFSLFVDDSDCFAMIMGVCSDNGYVQILQEHQFNPEKLSKIVLLTSYDTTFDIQRLTYAIVQWPTIFRSKMMSPRRHDYIAGPRTKVVTPLKDLPQVTNSPSIPSPQTTIETSVVPRPRRKRKRRSNTPSSCVPATSSTSKMYTTRLSKVEETQPRPQQKCIGPQEEPNVMANNATDLPQKSDIPRDLDTTPSILQHAQPATTPLEDPNGELTHPFALQPNLQMVAQRPMAQGPMAFAAGLSSHLRGFLPWDGSMAGTLASHIGIKTLLGSSPPGVHVHPSQEIKQRHMVSLASLLEGRRSKAVSEIFPNPQTRPDQNKEIALELQLSRALEDPLATSALISIKQPFVHVPMPNRAQSATYDPDRFLYQQSYEYLKDNHDILETIATYASKNYPTIQKGERPKLRLRIKIAQIIVSRLLLALQIQSLEDEAVERGLPCSLPPNHGRGDAFTHDWEMYSTLSKALKGRINRSMSEMARRTFQSGRAKADYQAIMDG